MALGLVLVPFPGPGWLIVIVGLLILASEFRWARALLDVVRTYVRAWTDWISAQSWPVRLLVGAATMVFVLGVLYAMAALLGLPGWVPGWIVPPLPGLESSLPGSDRESAAAGEAPARVSCRSGSVGNELGRDGPVSLASGTARCPGD